MLNAIYYILPVIKLAVPYQYLSIQYCNNLTLKSEADH
jgi:hypothetical protein